MFYMKLPHYWTKEAPPKRRWTLDNVHKCSGSLVDNGICLIKLSEVEDKPQRLPGPLMSMYFYDDTDDWPEYKIIKDYLHRLEVAHVESRKELQEAESASVSDPENEKLTAKVEVLKKELQEIEKKLNESFSLYR